MNFDYLNKILVLLGKEKRKLPFLISLYLVSSILDIIGIGLIAPFIAVFSGGNEDFYLTKLFDTVLPENHSFNYTILTGLFLLLVFFFKTIASIVVNKSNLQFSTRQDARLRTALMEKYQSMTYEEFITYNSSEVIQRIRTQAGEFIYNCLIPALRLLSEFIIGTLILLFLFYTSPFAMLFLILLLGLLVLFYDKAVKRKITLAGKDSAVYGAKMVRGIQEGMGGFKEIRVLGKEDYFKNIVQQSSNLFSLAQERHLFLTFIPRYLLELVIIIFMVMYPIIIILFNKDSSNIFSVLSVFGVAAVRIIPSANIIIQAITTLRYSKPAVSAIYDDFVNLGGWEQKNNEITFDPPAKVGHFEMLELRSVYYRYPLAETYAITDMSFTITRGQSIGFVGSSGAGKTTLIDIILCLLKPEKGRILLNGQGISNSGNIDNHFAYLPQQIFLVDDTIRRNVALGVEEADIDNDLVLNSLSNAKLSELISSLPNGIETNLGENGIRISGGQRQRIALARAFYHNRDVIVMDESTSALDIETEKEIVENIQLFKGKKTLIIIAHRLSTLKYCDVVYKLENGCLKIQNNAKNVSK